MTNDPYILLVYSSGHAIGIERKLKKMSIPCKLSSIPRGVSSDCGICVRFEGKDLETVRTLVKTLTFEIQAIIPQP
ncbi:MAG: DUF3343 domain-containing protein [Flexilinea sp.]